MKKELFPEKEDGKKIFSLLFGALGPTVATKKLRRREINVGFQSKRRRRKRRRGRVVVTAK